MNKHFRWIFWSIFSPVLSLIIWLFREHTWTQFIDILFIVSMLLFIVGFVFILVQDGIFDATSYGFRRLRYQMSSAKHRKAHVDDEFINPKKVKREVYIVERWTIYLTLVNVVYVILCLLATFTF